MEESCSFLGLNLTEHSGNEHNNIKQEKEKWTFFYLPIQLHHLLFLCIFLLHIILQFLVIKYVLIVFGNVLYEF